MRVQHLGMSFHDLHAGIAEDFSVDAVEPADFSILVCDQFRPVDAAFTDRPAVSRSVGEVLAVMGSVDQEFLRNATDVDTGATEIALLGDRDFGAEGCLQPARAHAAGAGTDSKKIIIVLGHVSSPFTRISLYIKSSIAPVKSLARSLTESVDS